MGLFTYLLPNLARIVQGHPVEILDYGGRLAHIGSQGFVNGLAALPLFDEIDELLRPSSASCLSSRRLHRPVRHDLERYFD